MSKMVEQNIEEIVALIKEATTRFNKTQICSNSDRELRKYNDRVFDLSGWHIYLQRYGTNTNIEVGQYKITPICDNNEDRLLLQQYLE